MKATLESSTTHLQDLRRRLSELEERAGSQRQRLEILASHHRAAQHAHSDAMTSKTRILGEFGAGSMSQPQVDAARRLVDEAATRMHEAEELVTAVEADLRTLTTQTQQIQRDIGPAMTRAWRAVFQHLAANRPPEVDTYLARLWAAAKANGYADFGGILSAVQEAHDFTATEKDTRAMLSKEFLGA